MNNRYFPRYRVSKTPSSSANDRPAGAVIAFLGKITDIHKK
jgi:hypothetical protein